MKASAVRSSLLASALVIFGPSTVSAATLSYAHYGPDRGWQAEIIKQFAEDVRAKTNGEVDIRITFGAALIATRDVLRGVGDGVADIGSFVGVMTPAELFNFRVGDLPVGSTDPWVGSATMQELARTSETIKAEFDKQNTVLISNFITTEVVLSCTEPVEKIDQLTGMKLRSNPPHSIAFEEFGAAAVSVAITDVYQSLDRGLITCSQTYIPTIIPYRHNEVAKHVTLLDFGQNLAFGAVMNKNSFEKLNAEQRKVVLDAGEALTLAYARRSVEDVEASKKKLTGELGVTIHELSDEDKARLDKAGQVTVDAFLQKGDKAVLDQFIELTKKYQQTFEEKGYPWVAN